MLSLAEVAEVAAQQNAQAVADPAIAYGVWRAWYALVVFEIQILAAGIDIAIVTLLVHPIETALSLNDVGFATITTVSIAVGGSLLQYPAGVLADILRRRDVLIFGSIMWTIAALVAARTNSGTMFFLARLIAGMGIGITNPAMFSMLTDAFPRARRPLAIGVYTAGMSIGSGIGLAICGMLVAAAQHNGIVHLSSIALAPWQQCFVAVAAMGVFALVLVATIREPLRLERSTQTEAGVLSSLRIFGQYSRKHWLLWTLVFFGNAIGGASYYGIGTWAPAFGMRHYGISGVTSIAVLGTAVAIGSLLGSVAGGFLAQPSIKRENPRLLIHMFVLVSIVCLIFAIVFPYMPSWLLAVVGIGGVEAATMAIAAFTLIAIQEAAPNEVRGQLFGMAYIICNISMVLGASLVAYLASGMFAKSGGLGPALAVVGGITCVASTLMFIFSGIPYERARKEMLMSTRQSPVETP